MKTIDTNINYLAFEDEYLSKVDENTFVDILKFDKDKNTYENIFKSYKSISAVLKRTDYLIILENIITYQSVQKEDV